MPLADATARLPAEAKEDISYVQAWFEPMDDAVRPLVERGLLPRATYVLPDGTPMVPADHAKLLHDTGGNAEAVAGHFRERYAALDALERPFAAYDRERFGGPSSRDRLIDATRKRFPEVWV